MSDEKRRYKKRRRAELEEQTHLKITESAVALHGTIGPAQTTISAIADLAGVRRSTVYRHFPDDDALFTACSSHWLQQNPLPNPAVWAEIGDMQDRRRVALCELYRYYRSAGEMFRNILRDEADIPALKRVLVGFHAYFDSIEKLLLGAESTNPRATAVVGHAIAYSTWRSLALGRGLGDDDCADLMCTLAGIVDAAEP